MRLNTTCKLYFKIMLFWENKSKHTITKKSIFLSYDAQFGDNLTLRFENMQMCTGRNFTWIY